MKAKIKKDAPEIFWKQTLEIFRRPEFIPKAYRDFKKKLEELAEKEFEVEKEYNNRVVLKYPPELIERLPTGELVTAIDLEKKLIEKQKENFKEVMGV